MLLGLLRDSEGNSFTPTHTCKKGRKYHYYLCQATKQRIPAEQIEQLIRSEITNLLQSPQRLLELLEPKRTSAQSIKAIQELARSKQISVADVLHGVTLLSSDIVIAISTQSIAERVGFEALTDEIHALSVPVTLKRCGGGSRLVLPSDKAVGIPRENAPLINALARAHDWVRRIVSGECDNSRALAKATGFDERYISRFMPLAFLAPDLTESLLEGKQSGELFMGGYVTDIPMQWQDQRSILDKGKQETKVMLLISETVDIEANSGITMPADQLVTKGFGESETAALLELREGWATTVTHQMAHTSGCSMLARTLTKSS